MTPKAQVQAREALHPRAAALIAVGAASHALLAAVLQSHLAVKSEKTPPCDA